jgi:hypothetical protein
VVRAPIPRPEGLDRSDPDGHALWWRTAVGSVEAHLRRERDLPLLEGAQLTATPTAPRTIAQIDVTLAATTVPEPATVAMVLAGLAGIAACCRRRHAS